MPMLLSSVCSIFKRTLVPIMLLGFFLAIVYENDYVGRYPTFIISKLRRSNPNDPLGRINLFPLDPTITHTKIPHPNKDFNSNLTNSAGVYFAMTHGANAEHTLPLLKATLGYTLCFTGTLLPAVVVVPVACVYGTLMFTSKLRMAIIIIVILIGTTIPRVVVGPVMLLEFSGYDKAENLGASIFLLTQVIALLVVTPFTAWSAGSYQLEGQSAKTKCGYAVRLLLSSTAPSVLVGLVFARFVVPVYLKLESDFLKILVSAILPSLVLFAVTMYVMAVSKGFDQMENHSGVGNLVMCTATIAMFTRMFITLNIGSSAANESLNIGRFVVATLVADLLKLGQRVPVVTSKSRSLCTKICCMKNAVGSSRKIVPAGDEARAKEKLRAEGSGSISMLSRSASDQTLQVEVFVTTMYYEVIFVVMTALCRLFIETYACGFLFGLAMKSFAILVIVQFVSMFATSIISAHLLSKKVKNWLSALDGALSSNDGINSFYAQVTLLIVAVWLAVDFAPPLIGNNLIPTVMPVLKHDGAAWVPKEMVPTST